MHGAHWAWIVADREAQDSGWSSGSCLVSITLSIQNLMNERKVALNGACVQGVTLSRNSVLAEGMKTREAGEMSQ